MTEASNLPPSDSQSDEEGLVTEEGTASCQEPSDELAMYELMFKNRFTDEDEDFMKNFNDDLPSPPCVANWYSRPKRTFDYSRSQDQGSSGYRGRGRGRGHWQGQGRGGGGYRDHWENHNRRDQGHRNQWQGHRDKGRDYDQRDNYGQRNDNYHQRNESSRHEGYRNQTQNYGQDRYEQRGRQDHYERHGRQEHHNRDRVHHAGMKQSDGSRSRDHHTHGQHPYGR